MSEYIAVITSYDAEFNGKFSLEFRVSVNGGYLDAMRQVTDSEEFRQANVRSVSLESRWTIGS